MAVALARFDARWHGFAVCVAEPRTDGADYWAVTRTAGGWRVELAGLGDMNEPEALARRLMAIDDTAQILSYADGAGHQRIAAFDGPRFLGALWISPGPVAVSRSYAASCLTGAAHESATRFRVLAGRAGRERPDPGALVCSCFGVGSNDISRAVRDSGCASVAAVGNHLKAGTNCGSCRAEIQGLIDAERVLELR